MNFFNLLFGRFKQHLDITPDKVDEATVIENARRAVEFRGVNLWILIFAVIIASVGLNIDSTPIIIGAMLISPLMGPITGIGLAVGINDVELMKRSIINYLVASLFAVFAAMFYFFISPLNEAQSELLARTYPTLYDVLIAFIGGTAGFLALSTKGNHIQVIIGVAISTALMPPLCTVGFGIATGKLLYALGAFYLFFINSVFIAIATFLSTRLMHFSQKVFVDKQREHRVRRMLVGFSLLALLPSFYITYKIVGNTIYNEKAETFINKELDFPDTQIIGKQIEPEERTIKVVIIGKYVQQPLLERAEKKLPEYNLSGTRLLLMQGGSKDSIMLSSLRGDIVNEVYKSNQAYMATMQNRIDSLQNLLLQATRYEKIDETVFNESKILFPQINSIAIGTLWEVGENIVEKSYPFVRILSAVAISEKDKERLSGWLRRRIDAPHARIEFYIE